MDRSIPFSGQYYYIFHDFFCSAGKEVMIEVDVMYWRKRTENRLAKLRNTKVANLLFVILRLIS